MRYILFILLILNSRIAISQITQPGLRDYQLSAAALTDSVLYIMSTDTAGAKIGLGKWRRADSLFISYNDTDWLKLTTATIPTNSDSAYRSGYTLLKGLYGGLATKIEFLKDGVLQFDIADGATDQNFIVFKPLQDGTRNVDFLMSTTTTPFSGSRNDNVFYWGWNLGAGGGVVEAGKGAIGLSMEDFYNPSGTNAYSEFHLIHYDTLGNSRRPMTFLLDVGNTTTWAGTLSLNRITFSMAHDIADVGFEFTMPDSIRSLFKMLNPQTGLGVEMLTNDASNEFQISNTMGAGGTVYLNSFEYTEAKRLRRQTAMGSTATTLAGNDVSGWFTDIPIGWGLDLTSGTLLVDSSQVATQYDLTTISGGTTDLTIGGAGPTYTIESSTGTDVTISAAGIATLSESPANTLIITATEVDGSITNEIQDITVTGASQPFTLDLGSDATDATFTGAGITTVTRSGNALTFTSTEVDGSTTNETNTIEEGNVSVQSGNLNIDFQSMFDVATDGGTEVNVSFDGGEATTVTTAQSDDYVLLHDSGAGTNEKMLWSDFSIDLISFYDGASLQGTGNAIDVGEGLDINMVSTEANINLDASEFQIDGAAEGTEYVLIHDIDTTAGHQIQRRLVSSFGGADGNGIYDGDGTVPINTDILLTDGNTRMYGTAAALKIEDTNGSGSPTLFLEGNVEDADAPMGSVVFQYTDTDFASDNTAWTIVATRETDSEEHSTLEITANEATASPPVATWEENQNLSDNTQETSLRLNSGIAYTQYWESTGANAITLDRGYYNIALLSGHTGTITLPEVYGIDEANIEIPAAQAPIGQTYVITNLSGSSVTIAAYNPALATNDDWLNGTEAGTYTLTTGNSVILKAVTIVSSEGHWFVYD